MIPSPKGIHIHFDYQHANECNILIRVYGQMEFMDIWRMMALHWGEWSSGKINMGPESTELSMEKRIYPGIEISAE